MDYSFWIFLIIGIGVWLVLKSAGQIGTAKAVELLHSGAPVIDVRSAREFAQGHLPDAVNLPLGELDTAVPRRFPDRGAVLLLHCLSGTRSGIAKSRLRRLGYQQVHNLGSFQRARRLLAQAGRR